MQCQKRQLQKQFKQDYETLEGALKNAHVELKKTQQIISQTQTIPNRIQLVSVCMTCF